MLCLYTICFNLQKIKHPNLLVANTLDDKNSFNQWHYFCNN